MSLSGNTQLLAQLGTILSNKAAGSGGTDLPTLQNPGDADKLLAGYELIGQNGQVVTGTIPSKGGTDLTASGATVTAPAGYYPAQVSKSVATATQATPSITVDSGGKITASATQAAGYVTAGTKTAAKQMTVQAAKTWTPGTSNQTLASGRYLTGAQTIKGDANLKAANIVKGVSIFGVTGTAETGGGGSNADLDGLIDGSLTAVESNATAVRRYAFCQSDKLLTAKLPKATSFGSNAFDNATALKTCEAPNVTTLGSSCFYGCLALEGIIMPKATKIPSGCFANCTKIAKVDLTAVTKIESGSFTNAIKLTALILRHSSVVTLGGALSQTSIASGTGYIYVPSSLVASYKAATNWSAYAAQIRAIEDYPDITGG